MSIFILARRMGTSVQMIDATYGHLARDAEDQDRGLRDAYDRSFGHVVGTNGGASNQDRAPENDEAPRLRGFGPSAPERIRTSDLRFRRRWP